MQAGSISDFRQWALDIAPVGEAYCMLGALSFPCLYGNTRSIYGSKVRGINNNCHAHMHSYAHAYIDT